MRINNYAVYTYTDCIYGVLNNQYIKDNPGVIIIKDNLTEVEAINFRDILNKLKG